MEYEDLAEKLSQFVTERDWHQYHHPKNMVMSLSVEVSELMEHFCNISEEESFRINSNPTIAQDVKYEMADVFHCLVHLSKMFQCKLEVVSPTFPQGTSPKNLVSNISFQSGSLMEEFLWLSEEVFKTKEVSDRVCSKLCAIYTTHRELCKVFELDPIAIALEKITVLEKKYPVEIVRGDVSKYFERKENLRAKL